FSRDWSSDVCSSDLKKTTKKSAVYQTDTINEYIQQLPDDMHNAIQQLILENETVRIRKALKKIGEKCYQLVIQWSEGYSDKEVRSEERRVGKECRAR